jgi:hypothetical protein
LYYDNATPKQKENIEAARINYNERRICVDNHPVKIFVVFGYHCNISCKMCNQMNWREQDERTLDINILLKQIDFLSYASQIHVMGGEPFALKSAVDFLNFSVDCDEIKNILYVITTNGTLINNYIDLLKKFKRLHLIFSVDSYGENYERIRRGAKWEVVKLNIETINELTKKYSGWKIPFISCVIMKSGLMGLYSLCKWVVKNKLEIGFFPLDDNADSCINEENIFDNPGLLDNIPDWQMIFCDCISLLYENNYRTPADQLMSFFIRLTYNYAQKPVGRFFTIFDVGGINLKNAWQYNLYGKTESEDSFLRDGDVVIKTGNDHIALPWITFPHSDVHRTLLCEITVVFPEFCHNCSYIYMLQSKDYIALKKFAIRCEKDGGIYKTTQQIHGGDMRLVLTPVAKGVHTLPERIIFSSNYKPDRVITCFDDSMIEYPSQKSLWNRLKRKMLFYKE